MRVLIVVHGFPPASMGGTEVYAAAQARALTALGDEVRVLARESAPERPEYAVRDDVQGGVPVRFVNRTFRDVTCFADSYRSDRITARASDLLDDWRPDLAHVHHLTCLSTTIVPAEKPAFRWPSPCDLDALPSRPAARSSPAPLRRPAHLLRVPPAEAGVGAPALAARAMGQNQRVARWRG
jgi:hypothetical protein